MKKLSLRFKFSMLWEYIIYVVPWIIIFIAPIISFHLHSMQTGTEFKWGEVFYLWLFFLYILLASLIHNYLVAPILIKKQKVWLYFICLFSLLFVSVFTWTLIKRYPYNIAERTTLKEYHMTPPPPMEPLAEPFDFRHPDGRKEMRPPMLRRPAFGRPGYSELMFIILFLFLAAYSIGARLFFKQSKDLHRLILLEKQHLQQQLDYLKYQISPHFLMNTLNNIHALIDIKPERAKTSIIELSKMLRFFLYDGNKQLIPLQNEIHFLENYIQLMKLRFSEKVNVQLCIPTTIPDKEIPPLLFITFVENAFKHGISYQKASPININIQIQDDQLFFSCDNKFIPKESLGNGVGLDNIKKRLQLLYPDNHTLIITKQEDSFIVELRLKLSKFSYYDPYISS